MADPESVQEVIRRLTDELTILRRELRQYFAIQFAMQLPGPTGMLGLGMKQRMEEAERMITIAMEKEFGD